MTENSLNIPAAGAAAAQGNATEAAALSARKLRVGVIFGGRSGEHAVSLMSAQSVMGALDPARYEIVQVGITRQGAWLAGPGVLEVLLALDAGGEAAVETATTKIGEATTEVVTTKKNVGGAAILPDPTRPGLYQVAAGGELALLSTLDVVIPVMHGTFGEDGALQGLLELADLAYVGAGVLGSAVAMDKGVFKDVMRAHGIPVLEYALVRRSDLQGDLDALLNGLEALAPYPLFTKPANLGSSVGISKCRSRADLYEGLAEAAQYDRRIVVERGLAAVREIEVSVLGNDAPLASVAGEIVPSGDFYSYESKYHDDRSQLLIPAPLPAAQAEEVRALAVRAYRAIDCAGLARVDFLLDTATGELYLNEINTLPGFTRISMYPKLWEATGLPYGQLLDRLVELALARKAERDATMREYSRGGA